MECHGNFLFQNVWIYLVIRCMFYFLAFFSTRGFVQLMSQSLIWGHLVKTIIRRSPVTRSLPGFVWISISWGVVHDGRHPWFFLGGVMYLEFLGKTRELRRNTFKNLFWTWICFKFCSWCGLILAKINASSPLTHLLNDVFGTLFNHLEQVKVSVNNFSTNSFSKCSQSQTYR